MEPNASTSYRHRISPKTLVHALGEWANDDGPIYRQLARGIGEAVERGDLPHGTVLPSERVLATTLHLSRGTVVAALQLLQEERVVERHRGSGTRVVAGSPQPAFVRDLAAGVRARRLTSRFFRRDGTVIDLGVSLLPDSSGIPSGPFNVDLARITALADGHGYHPLGLPALRHRLAELHTAAGVPTEKSQIVVTLGAQQAIALAARLLITPGDIVAVESPTYPGAIDAFSRAGARFAPVPVDTGGARPHDVTRILDNSRPRLLYIVPTAHNPTGTVMPDHRREEVVRLCDGTGTWLVEDESLSWLTFSGRAPRPMAAYARTDNILTVGSLSKVFWGGLRLGWIRAAPQVAARLGRLKAAQDLGNCTVSQAIALDLLDSLDPVLEQRRRTLQERADLLAGLLNEFLPDWRFRPPAGGLSLWVQLPTGASDDFTATALKHGVGVLAGSATTADDSHLDYIRLSYADTPDRLTEAAQRLRDAWHEHLQAGSATDAVSVAALG